ncbi:hypothetical protein [Vibrio sp. D431a]|uniref:hypothetical protein n=1 Tax=Vibrio sp. D431a TaxID=2837388 RepID=UPI002553E08E|nr:hypothetical protein [Vibrio sp. D431a]MDK9790117.1 hypothetical protein [Vibrio sp. D431a]
MKNILLLAGVSGSGKTMLETSMISSGFHRAITSTTRTPRHGETNGVDYHFTTKDEMNRLNQEGKLVESAFVRGEIYGMTLDAFHEIFENNDRCYVVLEPQGVLAYQNYFRDKVDYNVITVFLDCPLKEQEKRILSRLEPNFTDSQLFEVSKAIVSARNFEHHWNKMIDIDVYHPFSKDGKDIDEIMQKIDRLLDKQHAPVKEATISPSAYVPDEIEVLAVSKDIRSNKF